jgi:hypothetical protein
VLLLVRGAAERWSTEKLEFSSVGHCSKNSGRALFFLPQEILAVSDAFVRVPYGNANQGSARVMGRLDSY